MENLMELHYDGVIVRVIDPKMQLLIKKFIKKLQRQKNGPVRAYKKWTPEETQQFKNCLAEGTPMQEISKLLNRTITSLNIKMWHLGQANKKSFPSQSTQTEITL